MWAQVLNIITLLFDEGRERERERERGFRKRKHEHY